MKQTRFAFFFLPLFIAFPVIPLASAADRYWDGADLGTWSLNSNWATDDTGATNPLEAPGAGDLAFFNIASLNAAARTVNLSADQAVGGLRVNSSGIVTLLGDGTDRVLQLGTGGIIAGGDVVTFNIGSATAGQNVDVSLMGTQSWVYNNTATGTNGSGIKVLNDVSLGVAGSHTLNLGGTSGSTPWNAINGQISDGGLDRTLSINLNGGGGNRWDFSGDNSYTGQTTITTGALTVRHVRALGATSAGTVIGTSSTSTASLFFRGTVGTMAAEALTINGTGADSKGAFRNVAGDNTWTGAVTLASSSYVGADGGNLTFSNSADIGRSGSGTRALTFVGAGTIWVNSDISGDISVSRGTGGVVRFGGDTKTYSGATSISSAGTMVLNTGLSGTSGVTVNGNLRGDGGSINTSAAVTVSSTGVILPGSSTVTPGHGTLTMGALSLQSASTLSIDVNSGTKATDVLNVTALNVASGSILNVQDLGGSTLAIGDALLFIKNSGVWDGGFFTVGGNVIEDDSTTFAVGSNTYQINYNYSGIEGTGVALIAVVPEATSSAMVMLSAVAAGMRRRRKK